VCPETGSEASFTAVPWYIRLVQWRIRLAAGLKLHRMTRAPILRHASRLDEPIDKVAPAQANYRKRPLGVSI
jgi:hypothetical protein